MPKLLPDQGFFPIQPPAVAGEGAVGADDAVAWDNDREGVATVGQADSA